MIFNRLQVVCVVILQAAIGATGVQSVLAEEPTKDLLAAQIRDQGYRCSKPLSAKKDLARSRPMTPEEQARFLKTIFTASGW